MLINWELNMSLNPLSIKTICFQLSVALLLDIKLTGCTLASQRCCCITYLFGTIVQCKSSALSWVSLTQNRVLKVLTLERCHDNEQAAPGSLSGSLWQCDWQILLEAVVSGVKMWQHQERVSFGCPLSLSIHSFNESLDGKQRLTLNLDLMLR